MYKYFTKALALGIFITSVVPAFGQVSENPTDRKLTLDSKTLYEHGYNSSNGNTGIPSDREAKDTVMVTSVMNYFVMPDKIYNTAYHGQGSYAATNLTSSKFEWTVGNGTATAQTPNATGTSPWVKVEWTAPGETALKVAEVPQDVDVSCVGDETEIPVVVIARPTIGYNLAGFSFSECYDDATVGDAVYDFPVAVTTSSSQVLINVSIVKTNPDGSSGGTYTKSEVPVKSGVFTLEFSEFGSGGYGHYEVTITGITDRIARKCDVSGIINGSEGVFTYSVMPQPKTGPIFHIPNMF